MPTSWDQDSLDLWAIAQLWRYRGDAESTMREQLSHLAHALCKGSLALMLLALPSGRHWVLLQPHANQGSQAYYEPDLYATDIFLLVAVGAWLLGRFLSRERARLRWGPVFVVGPLVGFLGLGLAGVLRAVEPAYAVFPVGRLCLTLAFTLMLVNAPLRSGLIAWPLAASMAIQATLSVPQFLLGHTSGLSQLGEVPNDSRWPGASVVAWGERRWLRAYGLTQHPNVLGGLAMASLQVVAGYYFSQSWLRRLVLLGLLGAAFGTLQLTFSRGAWLGAAVGGMVLLGLLLWAGRGGVRRVRWPSLVLLGGALLAMVLVFGSLTWPLLNARFGMRGEGIEIRSVEERAFLGEAGLTLVRMEPWLGVGLGGFSAALERLAPEAVSYYASYTPVHTVALLVTAELGLVGGLLWLVLLVSPWLVLWVRRRQVEMTPWWAGLCAAMAALTVVSFVDHYVWSFQQGRLMLWLVWGLWAREWVASQSPSSPGLIGTENERAGR